MIPQEDILLSESPLESSAINQFEGHISEGYLSGSGMEVVVEAGVEFVASVSRLSYEKLNLMPGKKVWLNFKASAVKFFPA